MLEAAAAAGACPAGYVVLALAARGRALVRRMAEQHFPERAKRVLGVLTEMHGGALYDSTFGARQRGRGPYAALLASRFERARRAFGLDRGTALDTSVFQKPGAGGQLALWLNGRHLASADAAQQDRSLEICSGCSAIWMLAG